ncbi:cytochrome P450 4c21-like [Pectinophora gossypiella]|uniref:cytochrome P450 4c21-like n=1 Tax=Pectinophora gossypiella TaxID=13191 RepID=UPI00214E3A12|nr:cytochrome P450 4c21-like [Pectinophora gossypiella]
MAILNAYSYVLIASAVFICVCACWRRIRRARNLLWHLPHFPTLPIIGNIHQMYGDSEFLCRQVMGVTKMMNDTRLPFVSWLGPIPVVAVSEPLDVKAVSNCYLEKPYTYEFAHNLLGQGLITAPGSIWKHTSKKLSGVFTTGIVDGYLDIFNAAAQKLVTMMKAEVGKEPFDISHKYVTKISLESIYHVTLGVPRTEECAVTDEYHRKLSRAMELYLFRGVTPLLHFNFLYRLMPAYKELTKCEEWLKNTAERVINKRKEERTCAERNGIMKPNMKESSKSKFLPFCDVLLSLSESDPVFTRRQLVYELTTIMAAGHDTVSHVLTMSLIMIGSHPHVQDKLHEEIRAIFGASKRAVTKDDLCQLRYCEAVINETLRLYPAVPLVLRHADKDLQLQACTIPKGVSCVINILAAGLSQHSWGADADSFRPERWLEPQQPGQTHFFIPFSHGKRACIGKRYAMSMMKTCIAHCVRELVLSADISDLRFKIAVTMQPISGHLVQVRLRENEFD